MSDADSPDLVCHVDPAWAPLVRPAPARRDWMDQAPEAFGTRCLPLNIANAHGWEILNPAGFVATWNGGGGVEAVTLRWDGEEDRRIATSLFGQAVLTFHVEGVFRTPPGWNLWVGGSPNRAKDGLAPLTGVVETDWSPFTFTMNWRFTRPHHPVRFEAMEPFCFVFPVQRGVLNGIAPRFEPMQAEPDLAERFAAWSASRDAFQKNMRQESGDKPSDRWQKHYYRGVDPLGGSAPPDHQSKLRLAPFDCVGAPHVPAPPLADAGSPAHPPPPPQPDRTISELRGALAKREWLLETLERQRDLAPGLAGIERRSDVSPEEFLELYYAPNRAVVLEGLLDRWPAPQLWNAAYLKAKVGTALVDYQDRRAANPRFELDKDAHRARGPFDAFIDRIVAEPGNDLYLTAYNSAANTKALAPLSADLGPIPGYLDPDAPHPEGMIWIGPAGTLTALHHDLTNNLMAQIVGRKEVVLLPSSEVGRLYNAEHVFSAISDLRSPGIDFTRYPKLPEARSYTVVLEPGDVLFLPIGWWHQVRSLDFSVTITHTNFVWRNDVGAGYPAS